MSFNKASFINPTQVFKDRVFSPIHDDSVVIRGEKQIFILAKTQESEAAYRQFMTDMMIYLMKIPNSKAKDMVSAIHEKDLIYMGVDFSKQAGVFGRVVHNEDKLAAIVLDVNDFGIDYLTGLIFRPFTQ